MSGMLRGALASSALAFLVCLGTLSCKESPGPNPPPGADRHPAPASNPPGPTSSRASVLFVTIDTWRWDYLGASGAGRVETPCLDRLAEGGLYEREAVTPCPLTTPAHASLFTGLRPSNHKVVDCVSFALPEQIPTLAESFSRAGYETAAFVSGASVTKRFGLDRGFGTYDDENIVKRSEKDWLAGTRDGADTTRAAVAFLNAAERGSDLFLWVHYFDPHLPYRPRPEYDRRYPSDPYAAQVAFVDDQVSRLVSFTRSDTTRTWRLIVVGDHGEGFGDHGESEHGYGLYRSTLHVPLILHPRPDPPPSQPRPWCLTDVAPSLLHWVGLPPFERTDGVDLFEAALPDRPIPCMSLLPTLMFAVNPSLGIRRGSLMYMSHGEEELYDLSADPGQTANLAGAAESRETLRAMRRLSGESFHFKDLLMPSLTPSHEDLEGLMGLGYVEGFAPRMEALQRAHIRDVMVGYGAIQSATEAYYLGGDSRPVKESYRSFLAAFTRAAPIFRNYGKFLMDLGEHPEAFGVFKQAVRLNPQDFDAVWNLGSLYLEQGKIEPARILLEQAVSMNEAHPPTRKNLAVLYLDYLEDPESALPHFRRYLELEPHSREAPRIRAFIEQMERRGG